MRTILERTKIDKGLDMLLPGMSAACLCRAVGRGAHEGGSAQQTVLLSIVKKEDDRVLDRVVDKVANHGQRHSYTAAVVRFAITGAD